MPRTFADRIAAAEAALEAHLDAREQHVTRHQNWRRRLTDAQEFIADDEEAKTQSALVALMDERIRGLQRDAQSAQRDLNRLQADKSDALRDPGSASSLLRIIGKWEAKHAASRTSNRDRLAESSTRLGLVNIEKTRTGPRGGFFLRWGLRGVAVAGVMTLFLSVGVEEGDGPLYKRVSVQDGFGFPQITSGERDWSLAAIETLISETTGLPRLRDMVPSALEVAQAD